MFRFKFRSANSALLLVLLILTATTAAFAQWKEQVIYSFQGGTDGTRPVGGMVFDKAGNLYGVTDGGGATGCLPADACGTVFQLMPPSKQSDPWTETVLYVFKGPLFGDGSAPGGGLVIDDAGNLYGTTIYGGTGDCLLLGVQAGCGTIYELSPPSAPEGTWTETVLYSFPTAKEGYYPWGDLVFDRKGDLFGSSQFGGGEGQGNCNGFYQYCGAVFELSPPQQPSGVWTEHVLHGFRGINSGDPYGDGAAPNGNLTLDEAGNIYGTTYYGGSAIGPCAFGVGGTGCGTVFKLAPPVGQGQPWAETIIHVFSADIDGSGPNGGLLRDKKGFLYGTAPGGGVGIEFGLVFKMTPSPKLSWTETILHSFNNFDGAGPLAGLTLDRLERICGTTQQGYSMLQGTVFCFEPSTAAHASSKFSTIHRFIHTPPDGAYPSAPLITDKFGSLYGTTLYGGTGNGCGLGNCGTVFEISRQ